MSHSFVSVWQVIDYLMAKVPASSQRMPLALIGMVMEEHGVAKPGDRTPSAIAAGLTAYTNDRWTITIDGEDVVFTRK